MKLIQAMKKIKANKEKIADLHEKIRHNSAHLNIETPAYDNVAKKITEWVQTCEDLSKENIKLSTALAYTNLNTQVEIEIAGKMIKKSIAEWVLRRREYATLSYKTFNAMSDRGLQEGVSQSSTGVPIEVKLVRNYDPELRDKKCSEYREEPSIIDSNLEVVNAVTDLMELPK